LFAERKVSAFSLDRLPRISRAQSMDALSSQSLVAGYRAALIAAEKLPRFFPLLMTAAGTVPPAQVLVLGAGVAGLQAIATARRLGAVVSAYDVRTAAAEEVKSLGAKFISLDLEALEGAGGYAREMTEERAAKQRELLTPYLAASDAVITTAAVPGRQAPLLVDTAMVEAMRPGTVIVDLAADSGGNVELSQPGEEVLHNGVLIWGGRNMPSGMPFDASRLYARNLANLLLLMTKDGDVVPDLNDEIVAGCLVVHAGEVRS
jgi:NAD(P) transhydrogenase subunit alpha